MPNRPNLPRVSALILAAGKSERMGRPKLLLPIGRSTVIGSVLEAVLGASVRETVVVVGHDADAVTEAIGEHPVRIVHNADYEAGMFSSALCGLGAISTDADAVLVVLGDQPNVTSEIIDALLRAFVESAKGLVVPTCTAGDREQRGHPVLIDARYIPEIRGLSGGIGLRELFVRHRDDMCEVPFDTPVVVEDMDTPADYEWARRRHELEGK